MPWPAGLIKRSGPLDVLVCNAGTNVRNRSLETLDARRLGPDDRHQPDRGVQPRPRRPAGDAARGARAWSSRSARSRESGPACSAASGYSASKFGQAALGICIGREEGPHGIRSTVIYPGEVNTPILDARPVPVPPGARRSPSSSPPTSPPRSGFWSSSTPGEYPRADHQADRRRLVLIERRVRRFSGAVAQAFICPASISPVANWLNSTYWR